MGRPSSRTPTRLLPSTVGKPPLHPSVRRERERDEGAAWCSSHEWLGASGPCWPPGRGRGKDRTGNPYPRYCGPSAPRRLSAQGKEEDGGKAGRALLSPLSALGHPSPGGEGSRTGGSHEQSGPDGPLPVVGLGGRRGVARQEEEGGEPRGRLPLCRDLATPLAAGPSCEREPHKAASDGVGPGGTRRSPGQSCARGGGRGLARGGRSGLFPLQAIVLGRGPAKEKERERVREREKREGEREKEREEREEREKEREKERKRERVWERGERRKERGRERRRERKRGRSAGERRERRGRERGERGGKERLGVRRENGLGLG